ncbi:Pectinesterase inhibitor 9 [Linum perenne]
MANHHLLLLLLQSFFILITISSFFFDIATSARAPQPSPFITSSCKLTLYPDLCIQSLSPYSTSIRQNDHRRLALAALSFSLSRAASASSYLSRLTSSPPPRVNQAVKDCARNLADGVNRLTQSVRELAQMGGGPSGGAGPEEERFQWHMSNLQTWVSAALTCENSCVDGFGAREMDGPVKDAVRVRVGYVVKVTSNALALIHGFASKHDHPGRKKRIP